MTVESDARFAAAEAIRDWIHEQPFSICATTNMDTCPDWPMAFAVRDLALDAYLASLHEQGVRLVDLREVDSWIRRERSIGWGPHLEARESALRRLASDFGLEWEDAIERRFGGNEGSE